MKKNILTKILLVVLLVFNIVLVINNVYNSKPRYGYYLNKNLGITNIDVLEYNAPFEYCFYGKNNTESTLKMIIYIYEINLINYNNSNKLITVQFEERNYTIITLEELTLLQNTIMAHQGNYFIKPIYNQQIGFINKITINKI